MRFYVSEIRMDIADVLEKLLRFVIATVLRYKKLNHAIEDQLSARKLPNDISNIEIDFCLEKLQKNAKGSIYY